VERDLPEHTAVVMAIFIALVAAIRSAWSPCSLSMLSSLTSFGEASRGNRYSVASTAFVAAALVGGLCLGLALAVPALAIGAIGLTPTGTAAVVAIAAAVTIAADFGFLKTPRIPRQVDESWFGQFRPWVYGAGYGWQIGAGLATYVMTNAVYLMLVVGVMTTNPWIATCVGALFGGIRGLTLLIGWRLVDPAKIRSLHRRLDTLEPASRVLAISGQVVVLAVAAALWTSVWVSLAVVAVVVALMVLRRTAMQPRQCSTGSPADARWRSTRSASSSTTNAAVASPQVRSQFANIR
jgi:hypothetical protein